MGLKDEAKDAEQQLRGWLAGLPTHLTALTTILRYNGELRSNLQLARTDVDRLTNENKQLKERAATDEHRITNFDTEIAALQQRLQQSQQQLVEIQQRMIITADTTEIEKAPHGAITHAQLDRLVQGAKISSGSPENWRERREQLIRVVERMLPQHVRAVENTAADIVVFHQDAYAAGYHADEYALLGMAIKYAGLHGARLMINGTNGETFDEPSLEETPATKADRRPWYRRMWRRSK